MNKQNDIQEKNACIEDMYSLHTFEIMIPITRDNYAYYEEILNSRFKLNEGRTAYVNQKYYNLIKENNANINYCNIYECYDCIYLYKIGISNIKYVQNIVIGGEWNRTIHNSYILMQVNPRLLTGHMDNRYICIMPANELSCIMPDLKKALSEFDFKDEDINLSKLRRIDICTNINLESQFKAERYLKLLRKGHIYGGLKEKYMPYDPISKRRKHPNNELRYTNTNGKRDRQTLSIYLKYAQMLENPDFYDEIEMNTVKGQIRIELRIAPDKVRYLEKKYNCNISNELIQNSSVMGVDILEKYLIGLFGSGKIVSFSEAKRIINASSYKRNIKDEMKKIIDVTKKADMIEAFKNFPSSKSYSLKNRFNELNISPITAPDSWDETFENPITYIRTNNVNER